MHHPMTKPAPLIVAANCVRCQPCPAQDVCRVRALFSLDFGDAPLIDPARCNGCLLCIPACPYGAIRL